MLPRSALFDIVGLDVVLSNELQVLQGLEDFGARRDMSVVIATDFVVRGAEGISFLATAVLKCKRLVQHIDGAGDSVVEEGSVPWISLDLRSGQVQ